MLKVGDRVKLKLKPRGQYPKIPYIILAYRLGSELYYDGEIMGTVFLKREDGKYPIWKSKEEFIDNRFDISAVYNINYGFIFHKEADELVPIEEPKPEPERDLGIIWNEDI